MPTSRPFSLTLFCEYVLDIRPQKCLDIGVGSGKFGFLIKEYTDNWYNYFEKKTIIEGIEIFPQYIKSIHNLIYDKIYIGDALDILSTLGEYDLIVAADVLEHFSKENGIKFLDLIKKHCKHATIMTPTEAWFLYQESVYNNENERHLYCWKKEDLEKYGEVKVISGAVNFLII